MSEVENTVEEKTNDTYAEAAKDFAKDYFRGFLHGTVTSIAKAGAKFVESLTGDAAKAVDREKKKIEALGKRVAEWREENVGEDYRGD
jgi:hypothetical protein